MNRRLMDHNKMAALLEGRLPKPERDQAVAHLSAVDEDAEVFADAAAVLAELEAEDGVALEPSGDAGDPDSQGNAAVFTSADAAPGAPVAGGDGRVVPLRPPSTAPAWRRGRARWLALAAAVLACLVLIPLSRAGSRGPAGPGVYAAALADPGAGLPEGWTEQRPWRATRGGPEGAPVTDNGRAARLGALHVDLQVAAAAGQAAQARDLCVQITSLLGAIPGSGMAAPYCREIARANGQPLPAGTELLRNQQDYVADFFRDDPHFVLGAWAEAARLAAARRDAAFFASGESRRALDQLAKDAAIAEPARTAAGRVRRAVPKDGTPDWAAVAAATDDLTELLGS